MEAITQLKVVHLTSVHRSSDTRIVHRECVTLVEAGYDVVLIATGSTRGLPPGVRYRRIEAPRNRFDRMTRTMWAIYRRALAERADVYHFHDPELILVGLLLRLRGALVVFDVHEDIPTEILSKPWIPRPLRKPVALLTNAVLYLVQGRFSAIVAATPAIARRYLHPRKAVVANYPVIQEHECRVKDFSKRHPCVVYIGELTQRGGAIAMVKAAVHLPEDIRLTFVGPFENASIEKQVRELPAWGRVEYLGRRHRLELPAIVSQARAGLFPLLPSRNSIDALPAPLLEYMAAGLPVIVSSAVPSFVQLVGQHKCGLLVDPADPKAVADAISFMVNHPDEAQAMGARAFAAVSEHYQWADEGRKLTTLYAQIA